MKFSGVSRWLSTINGKICLDHHDHGRPTLRYLCLRNRKPQIAEGQMWHQCYLTLYNTHDWCLLLLSNLYFILFYFIVFVLFIIFVQFSSNQLWYNRFVQLRKQTECTSDSNTSFLTSINPTAHSLKNGCDQTSNKYA